VKPALNYESLTKSELIEHLRSGCLVEEATACGRILWQRAARGWESAFAASERARDADLRASRALQQAGQDDDIQILLIQSRLASLELREAQSRVEAAYRLVGEIDRLRSGTNSGLLNWGQE